MEKHMVKWD